jgi:pilus assembly protein Flp/PilA
VATSVRLTAQPKRASERRAWNVWAKRVNKTNRSQPDACQSPVLDRQLLPYFISGKPNAIENGLIAAGISIAILAAVNGLDSNLNTMFGAINTSLK